MILPVLALFKSVLNTETQGQILVVHNFDASFLPIKYPALHSDYWDITNFNCKCTILNIDCLISTTTKYLLIVFGFVLICFS